jgi:hypothetical protein
VLEISTQEKRKYSLQNGLKVTRITKGKISEFTTMKEGLIRREASSCFGAGIVRCKSSIAVLKRLLTSVALSVRLVVVNTLSIVSKGFTAEILDTPPKAVI